MSIVSKIFLAAALAAGLMLPGGARAALQGFSIELGDPQDPLTLDYNPAGGLSAEAAASNGQPAEELQNNGSYLATITGDYAVIDDLPPVNKSEFWLEFLRNHAKRQGNIRQSHSYSRPILGRGCLAGLPPCLQPSHGTTLRGPQRDHCRPGAP